MKQVFIRRKKSTVGVDRHTSGLKQHPQGISSWFPLASHFDLPGSESLLGIFQDPPVCVCTSVSQNGFQRRVLWVASHHSPFDLQGVF